MANHQEDGATEAASQVEQQPAHVATEQGRNSAGQDSETQNCAGRDQERDADVIRDEKEVMRRKEHSSPSDEPPEAKDPKVAEIESIMATFRALIYSNSGASWKDLK